jgi:alpha-maltose-1-phosphate synthase
MACGLPVVASRTGGIPDVVEDGETGLLVSHGVAADLAAALSKVVDDPGLASRLGAAGRRRAVNAFAWSDRARATHEVFLATLGQHPVGSPDRTAAGRPRP